MQEFQPIFKKMIFKDNFKNYDVIYDIGSGLNFNRKGF